jgi:hypothetical protein
MARVAVNVSPRCAARGKVSRMGEKIAIPGTSAGLTLPDPLGAVSLERQMVDFVEGRSDGAALMLEIYGAVADEPQLPPRLAARLDDWRAAVASRPATLQGTGRS